MSAKDIILKPVNSKIANAFVKKNHYSGKVVNNSQLHFGVFYKKQLAGIMSFGPSTDKTKLIGLVEDTGWNEFIELNRMAFSDLLPRNSESRALAIAVKLLRKNAPHLKWFVTFADGTQCGDGTIYRAAGFELTQVRKNTGLIELPSGETIHKLVFTDGTSKLARQMVKDGYTSVKKYLDDKYQGWSYKQGFMLRYIKLIQPNLKRNYEVLPYSAIEENGAKMYKGKKS